MSEIKLQVERIMKEGKIKDLAEMPDDLFGVIICRIYAARMEAPVKPVEIMREVKHGREN
jgi:hypothetical protein